MSDTSDTLLALPPAAPPVRPRTQLVATALAVAGSAMLLGGLLAIYLHLRSAAGGTTAAWLPAGVSIPGVPVNMALVTIVMTVITMQWAVYAIARDDRRNTYAALGLTLLLGVAFLNNMAFVYQRLELPIADSAYGVLVYAITGTQLALFVAAMVYAGVAAFRALGGEYSSRQPEGLAAAALFWHFTVVAFAVIWALVFALK